MTSADSLMCSPREMYLAERSTAVVVGTSFRQELTAPTTAEDFGFLARRRHKLQGGVDDTYNS